MNSYLLKSFVTLAESLHFGVASQTLNLSQSALTKQIKKLEDDLGAPLFKRNRQGSELTELGQRLLSSTKPLLFELENVYRKARRSARGEIEKLEIGVSISAIDIVSRVLPQFRACYPDVDVGLHDLSSVAQVERLAKRTLHIGFVRLPIEDGIAFRPVLSDRLALLIPRTLANRITAFSAEAIGQLPLFLLRRDIAPGLFDHIERFCALHDLRPSIIQYANELSSLVSLVGAGAGISLIAESAFPNPGTSVVRLSIDDPRASWDVGIAWRDDETNPMIDKFGELVCAHAASALHAASGYSSNAS